MKIRFLKLKNWFWITLGGILGINISCKSSITSEYGAPEAIYTVKGQVTNPESEPVGGIEVRMIAYRMTLRIDSPQNFRISLNHITTDIESCMNTIIL